jgi:formate hydrogenlyase subunit 6/NADH:ubiquinone oxidoreductase subunit I
VITVVAERCTACGLCLVACPQHALRAAPKRPELVASRCTGCGDCVEVCPRDAIEEHR